jgi:ABC-2 type transport system ATP-binding protein
VLLPRVPLVILDEPTNTLDPTMRDEFLEQLRLAKQGGKAVLFSSHVLHEVEAVCDRVLILRQGRLVHGQCMTELRDGRFVTATLTGPPPAAGPGDTPLSVLDGRLSLEYRGPLPPLLDWLARQPVADLKVEPLGLGPVYRKYHGGN